MSEAGGAGWTGEEAMLIAASSYLRGSQVCFIGVGYPSTAALFALRTHAPDLYLIYESGTLGPRPSHVPLSVADNELAETAQTIVSVPEIFNYWLQPGRLDLGVLGAAQVDRFANLNSTTIGPYDAPTVRLPGAGGAPEIAAACQEIVVVIRQSRRTFVESVDFLTSLGHGRDPGTREAEGFVGAGPVAVVTDLGVYEPDTESKELRLTRLQPSVTVDDARMATGWDLEISPKLRTLPAPSASALETLRGLESVGAASR
jgi:glutaconate CoA-transferase subunit B